MSSPVLDVAICGSCGVCRGQCPSATFPDLVRDDDTTRGRLAGKSEPGAVPPCRSACPVGQDVPGYLAALADGDQAAALAIILRDSPFPSVLGHVCHRPCEHACLSRSVQDPPRIRALKRFAAEARRPLVRPPTKRANRDVTIVGAGPAGLAAAWHLARSGRRVIVYESERVAGGMLAWAIPQFRLPTTALQKDIDYILSWGIDLRLGTTIDPAEAVALRNNGGILVLACGAPLAVSLELPGAQADGVLLGLEFLRSLSLGPSLDLRAPVVVLGGGNTAVDAARSALRFTNDVTLVYRRERADMPAFSEEIKAAEREGLQIIERAEPMAFAVDGSGRLGSVMLLETTLDGHDADGRRRFRALLDTEFTIRAATCVVAVGQQSGHKAWAHAFGLDRLAPNETGHVAPGVLAAGDLVTGPATVVGAVAAGITCAQAVVDMDAP